MYTTSYQPLPFHLSRRSILALTLARGSSDSESSFLSSPSKCASNSTIKNGAAHASRTSRFQKTFMFYLRFFAAHGVAAQEDAQQTVGAEEPPHN